MQDWPEYVQKIGIAARRASRQLGSLDGATKVAALKSIADSLRNESKAILAANALDIDGAREAEFAQPLIERLKLSDGKILKMAESVDQIAAQVDPIGSILEGYV